MKPAKFQEQEQQDLTNNNYFSKELTMSTKSAKKSKVKCSNQAAIPSDSPEVAPITTQEELDRDIQRRVAAIPYETLLEWTGIAQLTSVWFEIGDVNMKRIRPSITPFSIPPTPLFAQHLSQEQKDVLLTTLVDWVVHLVEVVTDEARWEQIFE